MSNSTRNDKRSFGDTSRQTLRARSLSRKKNRLAARKTPMLQGLLLAVTATSAIPQHAMSNSQLILAMRLDGHIRRRVCHTCEAETLLHLVVIQEGLVRLINGARHHLTGATGAGTGAA